MKQIGKIIEIENSLAKIQILRESACGGNCQSCAGCELKNHFIYADIKEEFDFLPNVGDNVLISMDDKTFYIYSILGYAVFIIFIILGAVISYNCFQTETASVLGAFSGLIIGFLIIKLCFKNKKAAYKITKGEN